MYDGSVLASYGDVIVVTVNYRLGVLGQLLINYFFTKILIISINCDKLHITFKAKCAYMRFKIKIYWKQIQLTFVT